MVGEEIEYPNKAPTEEPNEEESPIGNGICTAQYRLIGAGNTHTHTNTHKHTQTHTHTHKHKHTNKHTHTQDLCDLETVAKRLEIAGVQRDRPTFVLSECVLTYVNPPESAAIIHWASTFFKHAVFVTYEQVYPNDSFGLFMQKHFDHLGKWPQLKPRAGMSPLTEMGVVTTRLLSQGHQPLPDAEAPSEAVPGPGVERRERVRHAHILPARPRL
jgi:hypothetical protein